MDDWHQMRKSGTIIPYDGSGYWAKDEGNLESGLSCFGPKPEWATHVAWYNR